MKYRALFLAFLALSFTLVKPAAVDDDLEGSAHMENPDDEDFEETSGVPAKNEDRTKLEEAKKVNPPNSAVDKPAPTPPPAVFVAETDKTSTSTFSLDTTSIAILIGTIILVVLVIAVIVVCCRKKSNREYTRGSPSTKAYV
ncbi:unnamed protein product [Bursaphelenchus xylophilus]|uniref:(pine wood nematode) hypothetical protein n=1 Tax=Bursaphelenchus xylophilus TaxID=6326 RepID=A0A1I7ST04_BURXY|nr:unnamed protein product [Bursaphelenchus xylophilus]CAG9108818.1 unnamed protein product [Bursaphelenchus xylophilus]